MPAEKYKVPSLVDTIQGGISAFDDLADAIANPPANKPLRNAIGRSGRLYCDAVGSAPGQFLLPFTGAGLVVPLLCKPYWDGQNYTPPTSTPPFTGGQCPVLYRVPIFRNPPGPGNTGSSLANLLGPITSMTATNIGNFQFLCRVVAANQTLDQIVNVLAGEPAPTLGPPIRQDNQPDNCGNIPGTIFPGNRPPPTPTFPPGQSPGFEPNGQPFFFVPPIANPIIGAPALDPPPQPPTDVPGGGGEQPPGPGTPGAPENTAGNAPVEGEADEGEELVGVLVQVLSAPSNANKYNDVSVLIYRGIGYVRMGFPGRLGGDQSAATAQPLQFYHAQQRGLTAWQVVPRIGFTLRVTPYYRSIEQ